MAPRQEKVMKKCKLRALKNIRFATHFSGMDAWGLAMQTLGVPHSHVFAADNSAACRNLLLKFRAPNKLYDDVKECSGKAAPESDVLCSSPPCQSFSSAGLKLGSKDLWVQHERLHQLDQRMCDGGWAGAVGHLLSICQPSCQLS